MTEGGRTERGALVRLALVAAVALLGLTLAIVAILGNENEATDQRQRLKQATQVNGALFCEKVRNPGRDFQSELTLGIRVSPQCQRYVALLSEDLVYDNGTVRLAGK